MPTPIEETFTCDEMPEEWYERMVREAFDEGKKTMREILPDVVAEATRRGVEKGKREAWEEVKLFTDSINVTDPGGLSENATHENYWDNGYDAGMRVVCLMILNKLSTLSNPQKEV